MAQKNSSLKIKSDCFEWLGVCTLLTLVLNLGTPTFQILKVEPDYIVSPDKKLRSPK